ncbi:MAG: EMC3/TMCO1 family protein [Candidatus Pacearchaeota archaeon]
MKGMSVLFLVMILGLGVALFWDNFAVVKESVHAALDPSLGKLLDWNVLIGLILITGVLNFFTTLLQKYTTDQDLLKQIKEEQKLVQEELKLYKSGDAKSLELSKKSMELAMKTMPITMRPVIYTTIPFILLIRWFGDYFKDQPVKVLGFMSGIWAYIVFFVIWSIIFRKILKVH